MEYIFFNKNRINLDTGILNKKIVFIILLLEKILFIEPFNTTSITI